MIEIIIFLVVAWFVCVIILDPIFNLIKVMLGRGKYCVTIPPSGRGSVFHGRRCSKARVKPYSIIPRERARRLGYRPCKFCKGRAFYIKNKRLTHWN